MRKFSLMPGCALFLILTACSEPPKTAEKKEPEKLEPATGQAALWKMYQVARSWAPDAEVLRMDSVHLTEVPEVRGKAGAWQATFTSAAKGRARSYTYSVVEAQGNLHKGVFAGLEEGWTGPQGATQPFLILAVKIDTDAAYRTALGKAADYEKKSPGKPITLLLEKDKKFPNPVWRVIWGESVGTSDFSVYVDASLGAYLETMR
jgi:hypothetical protein